MLAIRCAHHKFPPGCWNLIRSAPALVRRARLRPGRSRWTRAAAASSMATAGTGNVAVVVTQYAAIKPDPSTGLAVVERPTPEPGPGEVQVRIHLRPINPADVYGITGAHPSFKPAALPAVPGGEGMGTVAKVGEGVTAFQLGQRVVGMPWSTRVGDGSWQQYAVVGEAALVAVPDAVTDEAAAQYAVNPLTAYGLLDVLKVPAGEWVLQNAAGSALGRQFIAIAKKKGVRTINLVRNKALHAEGLLAVGADEVLSTEDDDVPGRVMELTGGKGVWGAVDPVAGPYAETLTSLVRDGGQLVAYSRFGGMTAHVGISDLLYRRVTVRGFWVAPYLASEVDDKRRVLSEVMQLLAEGTIPVHSGAHYPITDIEAVKRAVRETLQAGKGGKLFLEG